MRVIAGSAKGHKLVAPKSNATRPALDRVKESIFSILFNVTDDIVLDLFAGSGSVGIEALSRGARQCTFVEKDHHALDAINKNLQRCHFAEQSIVLAKPVEVARKILAKNQTKFNLIFVDPPYERNLVNPTLTWLGSSEILDKSARIVIEHHPHEPIKAIPGLILTDQRQYGQTSVSFMQKDS